jgi:hypothetical protein
MINKIPEPDSDSLKDEKNELIKTESPKAAQNVETEVRAEPKEALNKSSSSVKSSASNDPKSQSEHSIKSPKDRELSVQSENDNKSEYLDHKINVNSLCKSLNYRLTMCKQVNELSFKWIRHKAVLLNLY